MLRTRMQWHQERQRVLAENVANADKPGFQPRDLVAPKFQGTRTPTQMGLALVRTNPSHQVTATNGHASFASASEPGKQIRPTGNAVSLEEQMIKVAANQMDYQAATT